MIVLFENKKIFNRKYYFYSESYKSSLQYYAECGFGFMRSFKDSQMRKNVDLARTLNS